MAITLIRAAGAIVFRRTESGVQLLVLRAFANWDFPNGLLETGESEFEGARREVREGTGLDDLDYPFGDAHHETLPYASDRIVRYYLAETDSGTVTLPCSAEPGHLEHDESRWVSFDEAEDLLPPRLAAVLDWARRTITGN